MINLDLEERKKRKKKKQSNIFERLKSTEQTNKIKRKKRILTNNENVILRITNGNENKYN